MEASFDTDFEAAMNDLKKLEEKIQKKAMRRALNKAARIVANDLKQRVAKDTGTLQDSITYKIAKSKKQGGLKAVIGASNKIKRGKGKEDEGASRYFHLSESGDKKESSKKVAEKIQASLDSTKGRVEGTIINEIQAELNKSK